MNHIQFYSINDKGATRGLRDWDGRSLVFFRGLSAYEHEPVGSGRKCLLIELPGVNRHLMLMNPPSLPVH